MNEAAENIAQSQRYKSNTIAQIKERVNELKRKPRITRKDGLRYMIKHGEGKFAINIPKNIIPVIVDEEPLKKAAGAENINVEVIDVNLNRMISNGQKRKER